MTYRHGSPDLAEQNVDSATEALMADLSAVYKVPVPIERLDQAVQATVLQECRKGAKETGSSRRLLSRLSSIAAAGLAVTVLAAATYRVRPLVEQALNLDPLTRPLSSQDLGEHTQISRTIHGFTVSIKRLYANSHLVVIGYAISGRPGHAYNSLAPYGDLPGMPARMPMLSDLHDRELAGGTNSWATGVDGRTAAGVLTYKAHGVQVHHGVLALRMTVPAISAVEQLPDRLRFDTIPGPFVFDLQIHVSGGTP
ncbi:MAG: hypothetical protein ACRDFS_09500 [Chloroflexota bacterium]